MVRMSNRNSPNIHWHYFTASRFESVSEYETTRSSSVTFQSQTRKTFETSTATWKAAAGFVCSVLQHSFDIVVLWHERLEFDDKLFDLLGQHQALRRRNAKRRQRVPAKPPHKSARVLNGKRLGECLKHCRLLEQKFFGYCNCQRSQVCYELNFGYVVFGSRNDYVAVMQIVVCFRAKRNGQLEADAWAQRDWPRMRKDERLRRRRPAKRTKIPICILFEHHD